MTSRERDRLGDIEQNKSRRLREMPEFNVIEDEVITIQMDVSLKNAAKLCWLLVITS